MIIDLVPNKNNALNTNLSDYISTNLHQDYNSLSHLFSEMEGKTIEKYFINLKIKKVTGFSPSYFKQLKSRERQLIESI